MSLLSRIKSFLSSLFGGGERDESAGDEAAAGDVATGDDAPTGAGAVSGTPTDETEPAYRCSICGTPVEDPEGPCPLCRSTDVVPAADVEPDGRPDEREEPTLAGTAVSRPDADEDAVNRLREIRRQAEASDDGGAGGDDGAGDGGAGDGASGDGDAAGDEDSGGPTAAGDGG